MPIPTYRIKSTQKVALKEVDTIIRVQKDRAPLALRDKASEDFEGIIVYLESLMSKIKETVPQAERQIGEVISTVKRAQQQLDRVKVR